MKVKLRRGMSDDSNTWIAYTDFLTTVVILFVIIAFVSISKLRELKAATGEGNKAILYGEVLDDLTQQPLVGSLVTLAGAETRADAAGKFIFEKLDLTTGSRFYLKVLADDYLPHDENLQIEKGRNFKTIKLTRARPKNKGDIKVETLPGDAYFEVGGAEIKPDALENLKLLGHQFRSSLKPGEVIVVQGHTDDLPYMTEIKSNWELSGERAAAVCRVFQEERYGVNISGQQLIAMGFGEFRPLEPVSMNDSKAEKSRKRARNRRIEIRKIEGAEVFAARKF